MNLGGMEVNIEMVEPDIIWDKDTEIICGDMKFEVLHTPGHSPGAVCYSNAKDKIVFTGDTLFRLSIGRTDFEGSDYATLINSVKTKL
jgi:glyoxylase-like metal-dependent hydrolase (beta-lactamase superfamily II)